MFRRQLIPALASIQLACTAPRRPPVVPPAPVPTFSTRYRAATDSERRALLFGCSQWQDTAEYHIVASGQLVDSLTGNAPTQALVFVDSTNCYTIADSTGHFAIRVAAPGRHNLQLENYHLPLYEPSLASVTISSAGVISPSRFVLARHPCAAASGGIIVAGTIRDAGSGSPVPDAQLFLEGTRCLAVTDSHGHYSIVGVAHDRYTLRVQCIGYEPTQMELDLRRVDAPSIRDLVLKRRLWEVRH